MEIFDYDNILLLPRKCRVESRSDCDTSIEFGPRRFKLPVVPANMKTVLDEPITEWLAANGYFYVMHRFDLDTVAYAKHMRSRGLFVSISSGVKPADYAIIDRLAAEGIGADYITIDIAHGHADSVQRMIAHIKQKLPELNGGFNAIKVGKTHPLVYSELTTDNPIDLTRYQLANCYMGRAPLINSGGASSGATDLAEAVKTAVVNKRAGGAGLISGRKAFQRPLNEGVALLNAIQDVYLSDDVTIA